MTKAVHHGQVVKGYLEEYCYNKSGVARKASMSKQALNDLFDEARVDEERLVRLSRATGHDFVDDIRAKEKDALSPAPGTRLAEPRSEYQPTPAQVPAAAPPPVQIIINLSQGDEDFAAQLGALLTRKTAHEGR